MLANWSTIMWSLLMWACIEMSSSILRLSNSWHSCNLLPTCYLSNGAQRLSQACFVFFTHATWCNRKSITFKNIVPWTDLFFCMNMQRLWTPPSGIIFSNSIFDGNNFHEMISPKSFSCKRISIFIFQVWKLLPISFSML